VVEVPTIEFAPPADGGAALAGATEHLDTYDWVVFTSANAVARVLDLVPDARRFGRARIAAVGIATAAMMRDHRVSADLVPDQFVAEALVAAMPDGPGRVLFPRAAGARDVIPDGLRAKGWHVDVVDAYQTLAVVPDLAMVRAADAILFTSASTVTGFGPESVPPVVACIGPITAGTAERAGIHVDVVAESSTLESLVDAVARRLGS
jgi:uroporphyrinogen III methyltransferase/synthase